MRLVEFCSLSDDSSLGLWEASCDTVSHQIDLKMARKEGGLMEIFNSVVASLPRKSDAFRFSAILSKPSLEATYQKLVENCTKIIPILIESGWKKSPDYQKNSLIDSLSLLERENAVRIFKMAQESRSITEDDVDEYFALFDKKLDRLLNYGKPQFETSTPEDRPKYANLCVEVLVATGASVKNAQKITDFLESQNMKVSKIWMTRIPEIFEKITNSFDYPTLFDVAMALDGFPLRKVFLARRFALQSMLEVFVQMAPSTKYKVRERVRHELEKASRFVGYAAELGHEAVLTEFSPKIISQSIEDSKRRLEVETIERLRRCGYLENLGAPLDELVRAQIASIREILPDFSQEIVHLALRHFSYDSEVTLANLLSRENLPLELLRLEQVELKAGVGSGEWPPLDFTASDEIERTARAEKKAKDEEMRRNNEKKSAMNLFSLAPILSDRPPSPPVDQQAELRARAEAYRTSVFTKLQKIRQAVASTSADPGEKIAVDAENLVPMATSKKYSALNSLKISEADRVAIRPTYDKYRYETPDDEGNGGVYDDEYDDEFDGREFKMERLNQELEISSDEDEDPSAPPGIPGPPRPPQQQQGGYRGNRGGGGGGGNGGRGGGRGRGGGDRGGSSSTNTRNPDGYTGGRDRQMKERHKSDHKQRGADRKKRGMGPPL